MEKSKLKKAIIFDCDNTLWDGIVGEEHIYPNIEFQNEIIFLAKHGVIIGLCSKNNERDVLEALKNQPLTEEYISVKRINWKDKVSNLKEIAEELNIGLDAIVMVDDAKFEVNLIKDQLPEVMAIFPSELSKTVANNFDLTGDMTKTLQYKQNYQRAKFKEQFQDIGDFLKSLEMILTIKVNDESQVSRIAELTQKTNQFNLTVRRYTEQQILEMIQLGEKFSSFVYSLSVVDRFGDNGLVGVCIVRGNSIDVFLLSCRVLGRKIEYAFLDWVVKNLKKNNYQGIIGKYVMSSKNQQVEKFYSDCGFLPIDLNMESITFSLLLDSYKSVAPDYFKYE